MKTRLLLSAMMVATFASSCLGQPALPSAQEEIVAFERLRLAAFAKADNAAFDGMVAEDVTNTHSSSGISTKAEQMAVMRVSTPEAPLPALSIEEPKVQLSADAAVLIGKLVE